MDAGLANRALYDRLAHDQHIAGSPHLQHPKLYAKFATIAKSLVPHASGRQGPVRVLDVGAGHGESSLPFLEAGAEVTAVEPSSEHLSYLSERFPAHFQVIAMNEAEAIGWLSGQRGKFDIVSCVSLLHHIPDYGSLVERSAALVAPGGAWFSFQDPILYRRLGRADRLAAEMAYASWRVRRPNALAGVARKLRRLAGAYNENSVHDMAEYHVVRGGVDADVITGRLTALGFQCQLDRYWSTQSATWQRWGERAGWVSSFSVVGRMSPAGRT